MLLARFASFRSLRKSHLPPLHLIRKMASEAAPTPPAPTHKDPLTGELISKT